MIIVSNTSPLIALAKLDKLALLEQLFKKVLIPQTVYNEFLNHCPQNEEQRFLFACENFIETVAIKKPIEFTRNLDLGEREVLTLALELNADITLIDDKKAFNEAKEKAIKTASTRAILIIAEKRGLIQDYHALEQQLRNQAFFIPNY
jgi:predicted nucleic acid-binding protein